MMNKQFTKEKNSSFLTRRGSVIIYRFEGMKHNEIREETRNEKFYFFLFLLLHFEFFNAKPLIIKKSVMSTRI
jgi:hypothetical protein